MKNNPQISRFAEVMGFTYYEAQIYLTLVTGGPASIMKLAKDTGIPRTALYNPTNNLLKKSIVSITKIGKRNLYVATSPQEFKGLLRQKEAELDNIVASLNNSMSISSPKENMQIRFFPGRDGLISAARIFLSNTKERYWYSFENLSSVGGSCWKFCHINIY